MKKSRTFTIIFESDDGGWHARIPEVRGCGTWGKSIGLARRNIREALATCVDVLGEDAERIAADADLREEIRWPAKITDLVERPAQARKRAEQEAKVVRDLTRAAVVALQGMGLSVRDAAATLGVSHQRIHQVSSKSSERHRTVGAAGGAILVARAKRVALKKQKNASR